MSADRDTTRIVRSWLRTDEHESADRVLDDVLALLDATPQRRPWWSARRFAEMNLYAKLAIAAAAVVVVAVVGINLLPSGGSAPGVGGGPAASPTPSAAPTPAGSPTPVASPTPSPAPTSSTAASLRPEPTPAADAFPPKGELAVGRQRFVQNGVPFSLDVSGPGWISSGVQVAPDGGDLTKADGTPEKVWMLLWSIDGVYTDPCGHAPAAPVSPSAAALAAAVAGIPGFEVVDGPSDITLDGRPAKHVRLHLPADLPCSGDQFYMWYDDVRCGGDDPCQRWATSPGNQVNDVWIVEIDGTHVWIEAETFDTASPETLLEVQQMIDSIQFE